MPNITFRFENGDQLIAPANPGDKVLAIARQVGVAIDAPCAGNGTCGKCRVRLLEGDMDSPPSLHLPEEAYADGWRLACESKVTGDVTVLVPETASAFKTGIRTADLNDPAVCAVFEEIQTQLRDAGVLADPAVTRVTVAVDEPTLEDTMPDNERVERAVAEALGVDSARLTLTALRKLAWELRENGFRVNCVVRPKGEGVEILDILPPEDSEPICALAIDIGTTTVSAALADMATGKLLGRASAGNGQIRYGADVINRIIESTRPGGSERLRKAVVEETLQPLIDTICRQSGISRQRIYRVSIAANTTMTHLLLGLYSDPVRMEPYIPSFFDCGTLRAAEVLPGMSETAELLIAPNVGSYVGGDITAGVLASSLWNNDALQLFIDLGTNGELVLGSSEYMFTCACSAGPAFEGGDISCGMRATNGAIEAITIDKETMEPNLSIIGDEGQKPIGICGSGIIDTVAELFRTGIIDARGKYAREGKRIQRDEHGMGRYIIAFEDESADGREVSVNEVDLDNFIRAKGAIFSAIQLMMEQVGLTAEDVDRIWIAGGIGGAIDFDNAITIGMFPDVDREKFSYIGNSSLTGAYAMALSREATEKVAELGSCMTYVELSNEPGYMDEFISACFLPHTNSSLFPSVGM